MPDTGIVVIGRNEGRRLVNCLNCLKIYSHPIVYVDSGSTDSSVEFAQSIGFSVVELDNHIPFSAARARNEGFFQLIQLYPDIEYVQFIDGDCEPVDGWLSHARQALDNHTDRAIVCGRRKERFPDKSIYNLLCDMEWDTPVGSAQASGGDFMIRISAFKAVGGFNPSIIAGEEPELGFRLREKGWQIWRLNHPMTIHDAAIFHFSQWWKKMQRTGYAYAQGFVLHGTSNEKYYLRETMRPWFWVVFIPLIIFIASLSITPIFFSALAVYPVQMTRIMTRQYSKTENWKTSFYYTFFNLIGKLPELTGQMRFISHHIFNKKPRIIEYK